MALGKKIAVIGAGNMGEALIAGMLAAKAAVPDDIHATDIVAERLDRAKARHAAPLLAGPVPTQVEYRLWRPRFPYSRRMPG
jgi:pyrroline-5-carboxylate reductase